MRHLKLVAVVGVLVILTARMATDAEGQLLDWETLGGHHTMCIMVQEPDDTLKAEGLNKERLQTIVELRLRQAGIRIHPEGEIKNLPFSILTQINGHETKWYGVAWPCRTVP